MERRWAIPSGATPARTTRVATASYLFVFIVSLALASLARADGGVFLRVDTRANLPDQQALIVYKDGTETLAIETRARAEGDELAWVVPLPAVPEILPATTGTFPTLRSICEPIRLRVPWQFLFIGGWVLVVALSLHAQRGEQRKAAFVVVVAILLVMSCLLLPTLAPSNGGTNDPGLQVIDRAIVGNYDVTTIDSISAESVATWLTSNGFKVPP